MKKAIIILLCLALLGGGGYFGYRQYQSGKDDTTIVDVVPLKMLAEPASSFMYTGGEMYGNIYAANAQKVYVDTTKLVQKVCVKQGQTVKKGETILEYDMTVVELDLAQKENQVALIEQNIKMANKELQEIRSYRPSEEAPRPNTPDEPEEPDLPETPEEPETPLITVSEVGAVFTPVSGSGTQDDPFVIACSMDAVVRKPFMLALASGKRCAELHVYDESGSFLYKWILNGGRLSVLEAEDWQVTDGLEIDPLNGTIGIAADGVLHGQLSFAMPQPAFDYDEDDMWDFPMDDDMDGGMDDYDFPGFSQEGHDYVYTRAQIARMITEKQNAIKELELQLKSAELQLENARKQKSDGKVVAEVDGIVKKIGKAAGEADEEQTEDEMMFGKDEGSDDNAFAVIEGEGGIEVVFGVSELNLPHLKKGTKLNVMSYMNGAMSEAIVTETEDTPESYEVSNWGDSPNNSTYRVHAKIQKTDDFVVGNWVTVSLAESSSQSNSVYLPIHYVRQEGGDYYVMKQDENERLVKQYVSAGQIMYGYYIEITGGLDKNDKICFPYGTSVKEGVRTNETTEILYPSNY